MMENEISCRKAEIKDITNLRLLAKLLGYDISEKEATENLVRNLVDEKQYFQVAELKGEVIGFIQAELYQPFYEPQMYNVLGLAVREEVQGQGIGSMLLQLLERHASAYGISVIRLNSGTQRYLAHEFYKKQGYISNHEQKRFIKQL